MIEMAVGDQDPIDATEANPGSQDLTLGALATVHQVALIAVADDL